MASAPDLKKRIDSALDDVFKITKDLDAISKDLQGVDDARCRHVEGFRLILSSTWASMIDLIAETPIFMTAEQEDDYWRGHGRYVGRILPKTP